MKTLREVSGRPDKGNFLGRENLSLGTVRVNVMEWNFCFFKQGRAITIRYNLY